jgi:hypothetical protein
MRRTGKMPHYADGTPAEIGDLVKGKPYNTDREIVGTLMQVTEGTETCNCIVAFAEAEVTTLPVHELLSANIALPTLLTRAKGGRVGANGGEGLEHFFIRAKTSYGEVRVFTKIG